MTERTRVLRGLRLVAGSPRERFAHRLAVGLVVAALILILSILG